MSTSAEPSSTSSTAARPRTVLVTGATGFIGTALVGRLRSEGHSVRTVGRGGSGPVDVRWDARSAFPADALADVDAIVHLAGETIGQRWSGEVKRRIRESRIESTRRLAEAVAAARPRAIDFLSGSAVGIYGDTGDRAVDERSPAAGGFLGETAQAWEKAAEPARRDGVRLVNLRSGVVLSPGGSMLEKLLPLFNVGAGGKAGSGRQYLSWIALDDWVEAVAFLLGASGTSGPVNVTSPNPVTNETFARTLGEVIHRPAFAAAPAMMVKLVLGEMGEEMILRGQRVLPRVLLAAGFRFRYAELEEALRHEIAKR